MNSSMSMGMLDACEVVRFGRRSLLMLDLKTVLICLSPLKDLSAVHEVAGRVQRIVTRALMLR